jgi:hypothetical protein
MSVSIVIPARNAAPYMRKLLHTLADNAETMRDGKSLTAYLEIFYKY